MQKFIVKHISVQRPENYHDGDLNKAIEAELIRWQDELGEQYTLIGCVPAGIAIAATLPYLTTWAHLHEDRVAKSDDEKSIAEEDCSGPQNQYIGDSQVHDIEFGDIVRINGVNFKLTHFGRSYEEARATLTPLKYGDH